MRFVAAVVIACAACGGRSMLLGATGAGDEPSTPGVDASLSTDASVSIDAAASTDAAVGEEDSSASFEASTCPAPVGETKYVECAWMRACCGFHLTWTCGDTYDLGASCPGPNNMGVPTYEGTCSVNGQPVGEFTVTSSICGCGGDLSPIVNAAAQKCGFRP